MQSIISKPLIPAVPQDYNPAGEFVNMQTEKFFAFFLLAGEIIRRLFYNEIFFRPYLHNRLPRGSIYFSSRQQDFLLTFS